MDERSGILNKAKEGDPKGYKEDELNVGTLKKLEKVPNEQRGEEERKLKLEAKEADRRKKVQERRKRMLEREKREAEVGHDLLLVYPIISYKEQFFVEDNYPIEEKKLRDEIELKKKEA